jgi:hypothetical protein
MQDRPMILKDFFEGGFPIGLLSPVICIRQDHPPYMAYNRTDLVEVLKLGHTIICLGVWPGKKSTDCFILDPEAYSKTPLPPATHKKIDNADYIHVQMDKDQKFVEMSYRVKDTDYMIKSQDIALFDYIKRSGLRYISETPADSIIFPKEDQK